MEIVRDPSDETCVNPGCLYASFRSPLNHMSAATRFACVVSADRPGYRVVHERAPPVTDAIDSLLYYLCHYLFFLPELR